MPQVRIMDEFDGKRLLHLWQGGMSLRQLARIFSVSPGTIQNELKRNGADRIRAEEGRILPKGDRHYGSLGVEAVERIDEADLDLDTLAEGAGVDAYQLDQIVEMAARKRRWCPPTEDYLRLREYLWGTKSTVDGAL